MSSARQHDQHTMGRATGAAAGVVGCLLAISLAGAVVGWKLLGSFLIPILVAAFVMIWSGRLLGPQLTDSKRSVGGSMMRGALAGLSVLAVSALVGALTQILVELNTPLPRPFRGPRPVKVAGILVGTVSLVMLVGSAPAVVLGASAGLRLRWRCLQNDRPTSASSEDAVAEPRSR